MRARVSLAHWAEISVERSAAASATLAIFSPSAVCERKASWKDEVSIGNFAMISCMVLVKSGVLAICTLLDWRLGTGNSICPPYTFCTAALQDLFCCGAEKFTPARGRIRPEPGQAPHPDRGL